MIFPEIQILIPCHSLEDFPSDQQDLPAASLLNVFSVAFHPALLAWTREFPQWRRADDPPLPRRGQLILIPTVCEDWLPHQWADDARRAGATVVSGLSDRQEMIDAALNVLDAAESATEAEATQFVQDSNSATSSSAPQNENDATNPRSLSSIEQDLDTSNMTSHGHEAEDSVEAFQTIDHPIVEIEAELVADFLALGTNWLLIELLTRRMRQFGNIDDTKFFQRVHSAAKAAVANDSETAKTHLRACFEMLLEARERFYPVDCYLLDLCLAVPDIDHERLVPEVEQPVPISILVSSDDLASIINKTPEFGPALSSAWQAGRACVIGGEDRETSLPLLPLESVIHHFQRGRTELQRLSGHEPIVWGRRKFGLSALMPQLLARFGYKASLHVVLDDGIYPDAEYTKLRWRGVDGTLIDALSRIPLAADSAGSYLRFPLRMSESMDHDQVAGLILARWPSIAAPWFDDLRRSQKYAPCLGRFVTLDRFFEQTELPGQLSTHKPGEYFSPFLIQHVARRDEQPITRYVHHANRRRRFDLAVWYRGMSNVLLGEPTNVSAWDSSEQAIESATPTAKDGGDDTASHALNEVETGSLSKLTEIIMHSASPGQGILVINPLSFTRRTVVSWPEPAFATAIGGAVKAVEFDPRHPAKTSCVVEVPGCGYTWIPAGDRHTTPVMPKQPLAERGILRNDVFEVAINEKTGGIAHIRFHNQRMKRLSQQLSFRFPRERTITVGPEPTDKIKSQYAEMRCRGHEVVHSGTARGELVAWGDIVDQANNEKLASFRQTIRVWRGLSTVEIEIELSDLKMPDGDPWNNYFASRFAWNDSTAAVTRSIYHTAQSFSGERFETSDYIEIAAEDERLTIVPHGLPFHRKTGDRMVDSLLVVAGENERRFRFTIAVDAPYPLEAAWNATTETAVIPTDKGQPRTGPTGWFIHVDSRHVQMTRILDTVDSPKVASPLEQFEHSIVPSQPGFAVRLLETEGRSKRIKLRTFRRPTFARKRDFQGKTVAELIIEGDAVLVDINSFEVVDVELRF